MRAFPLLALPLVMAPLAWADGGSALAPQLVDPANDVLVQPRVGTAGTLVAVAHPAIDVLSVAWGRHNGTHGRVEWRVQDLGDRAPLDALRFGLAYEGGAACAYGSLQARTPGAFTSWCWTADGAREDAVEGAFDAASDAVVLYFPVDRMPGDPRCASSTSTLGSGAEVFRDEAPDRPEDARLR